MSTKRNNRANKARVQMAERADREDQRRKIGVALQMAEASAQEWSRRYHRIVNGNRLERAFWITIERVRGYTPSSLFAAMVHAQDAVSDWRRCYKEGTRGAGTPHHA